jgi:hypothetical protein
METYEQRGVTRLADIPPGENGKPLGTPWEVVRERLNEQLSCHYGIDFNKVGQMIESGELSEDELTDELLASPRFKYEPSPGFKPQALPEDFKPDPLWAAVLSDEE